MTQLPVRHLRRRRGSALVVSLGVMTLLSLAAVAYVDHSTQTLRAASHDNREAQATHLCEAGVQSVLRALWRPFREAQKFTPISQATNGSSPETPTVVRSGSLEGGGRYVAGVVGYQQVSPYLGVVTVRAVGYHDTNENGNLDNGEAFKEVRAVARYELARSQVFDYTYFVNNYGWMDGFAENQLIVNGDMRANGNFNFLNGSPTVNGSVIAASNDKLVPAAPGFINTPPVKWADNRYVSEYNNAATPHRERWRQPYNPATHGAPNTELFEKWRNYVFFSNAQYVQGGEVGGQWVDPGPFGAVAADATGSNAWTRTGAGQVPTKTLVDTKPTSEVVMPDLSDLSRYQQMSADFSSNPGQYQKQTFLDGTANPNYGQPAYIEVWNSGTNSYQRLTNTSGQVNGSVVLVGTAARPIRIYGPVTVSQDVVIKGHVSGQGTVYSGRNVHVIGSIRYANGPDFRGNDPVQVERTNEKRDLVGLAARGSVITGDPTRFSNPYPLAYMTPPFTKGRYDDNGQYIPPFNALERDATGRMRYQSVVDDTTVRNLSEGVNVIDAILYTNFVGGGNVGMGGGGTAFNGTLISKDEAIVCWSLPVRMNYDVRIRERGPDEPPLIDINLPRQPVLMRSTWQDRGYFTCSN